MKSPLVFISLLAFLLLPAAVTAAGNISVTSSPSGAAVYLDDVATGLTTPTIIESVTPGTHLVMLTLDGYSESITSVTVSDDTTTAMDDTVALTKQVAPVSFRSVPKGATVYVDDVNLGTTNDTFEIASGSREVVLVLDGYSDWSTTLLVNSTVTSLTVELESLTVNGSICFTSSPSSAGVYIEDEYYGTTPLTVGNLTEGSYDVLIWKSGYSNWTDTVYVMAGEEYDEFADLDPVETEVTTATTTTAVTTATTSTPVQTIATAAKQPAHMILEG